MITAEQIFEWFKAREGFGLVIEGDELVSGVPLSGVTIDGHFSLVELARMINAASGPSYHTLRLAERFQAEAREYARTARVYRERAIDGKRYVMSHRLDTMMAANNANRAADFARRARVLMGIEP